MPKQLQNRRLIWLALLLVVAFSGLGYRLVDLQVLCHADLLAKAQQNTQREIMLEPRRGDILDARGNLLATSIFVKTVCADPTLLGPYPAEVARALAPVLQVSESDLYQRLLPKVRQTDKGDSITNRYVVLRRKVPAETWERIRQTMATLNLGVDETKLPKSEQGFYSNLRTKAIFADPHDEQVRVYPNQTLAAHVLGFVGVSEHEVNDTMVRQIAGREGIEYTMNTDLSGVAGWRLTETDGKHHEMLALRDQDVEAHDGLNVVLTIDAVIQHIVETALADAMREHTPVSASAIVVRPRTGEILAMATLPTYDPNNPGASSADARRNRVITDMNEPGSTFKIIVVSGALNDGVVRLTDQFDCEHGHFAYAGRVLHDHEAYGILSVENIITKSSNIGAAKVGLRMGPDRLYHYARDYGIGERTGIKLLGEVSGILRPVDKWNKLSITRIPMGHEVATTPLQMVMAMSAIANHGWLMRPKLVSRLEDGDHNVIADYPPQTVRQVVGEAADREMIEALKTVVTPQGTAAKAALDHYTVAGKTGTAQKAENGGYAPGKYFASFIGFFPADNPEVCISVVMDEPKEGYYGGIVAGPVFKDIATRVANYLNIRPDKDVTPAPGTPTAIARSN